MKLTEKMSYLQGLLDGLDIDNSTKEGKALVQMADVMNELVAYVEDLQSQVDELTELCDILDQDLGQVEDDIYDEDDEDYEEIFEVECPSCGEIICFEGDIDEDNLRCPACGEKFACIIEEDDVADLEAIEGKDEK